MCSIAGVHHFKTRREPSRARLEQANRVQSHRGPDDSGIWIDGCTGLAHTRLSIIGLADGQQPMLSYPGPREDDPPLAVCFNGEIYNYRELRADLERSGRKFRTGSDTEVLLALYEELGARGFEKLVGQFAFALCDPRNERFVLARDHMGQKPLYFAETPDGLAFASELKGLLALAESRPEFDPQALWDFLTLSYVTDGRTPFHGVHALPPGHRLVVERGAARVERYWDVPLGGGAAESRQVYDERVRDVLRRAVRRTLVADVPIGVFLSAGMDSTSILMLATELQGSAPPSFTVDFDERSYAEGTEAEAFASHVGSAHTTIHMGYDDVPRLLDSVVWHTDTLQAMPSALPLYMVAELASRTMKCVLHGGGGDELFLGYPTYVADLLVARLRHLPIRTASRVALALSRALPASGGRVGLDYKARQFLSGVSLPPDRAHYHWRTIFGEDEKQALLTPALRAGRADTYASVEPAVERARGAELLDRCAYVDLKTWWVDLGLMQADGITMAHGLEARLPFMDLEVVETAMGIPPRERIRNWKPKALLRRALRPLLPDEVTRRKKMGYHVPLAVWFRGPLLPWLRSQLAPERLRAHGWFEPEAVGRIVEEHAARRADHSFRLWNLVVALRWKELMLDGNAAGPAR